MISDELYSERQDGPTARNRDELPESTRKALVGLIGIRIKGNWFAHVFPENCDDGHGVAGTDTNALLLNMSGMLPEVESLAYTEDFSDATIFDLLEYFAALIAKPIQLSHHDFMTHWELGFDEKAGRDEFLASVNRLLERGGTRYEMLPTMKVTHIGSPEAERVIAKLRPASGDTTLDELLVSARTKFSSRRRNDRAAALEKLWDGFERLKTLGPGSKKQAIVTLLGQISEPEWRAEINDEMIALTRLGNKFHIRHFETDRAPVPDDAVDYLFTRLGALIVHLLAVTGGLSE
jgi:hypothetical protein